MKHFLSLLVISTLSSVAMAAEIQLSDFNISVGCQNKPTVGAIVSSVYGMNQRVGFAHENLRYNSDLRQVEEKPLDGYYFKMEGDNVILLSHNQNTAITLGKVSGISEICNRHNSSVDASYIKSAYPQIKFEAEVSVTQEITKVGNCGPNESTISRIFGNVTGMGNYDTFGYPYTQQIKIYDQRGNSLTSLKIQSTTSFLPNTNIASERIKSAIDQCEKSRDAMTARIR